MSVSRFTILAAVTCAVFFLLTGCGQKRAPLVSASLRQTQSGVTAALSVTPWPPHTGDNVLNLALTDAATGAPIGDANVTASANMESPRLPGNPVTGRSQGNGQYQIPVRLGIASRYTIALQVKRPAGPAVQFSFPIEAQQ